MGMVLGRAKRRRDFLIVAIPGVLAITDGAALSFGLDNKLVWIASIVLFVWPIYLITEKFPEEEPEVSYLQSVRATIYFTELLVLIPANGFLITPRNPITILLTPLVSMLLVFLDVMIYRGYRDEVKVFDKRQMNLFYRMIIEAGAASIWLSVAIVQANFVIGDNGALSLVLDVLFALVWGFVAYWRETKSANSAQQLAEQLRKSRWQQKLNFRKRQRRGIRNARNSEPTQRRNRRST